jgi:hypothetical protein
MRIAFLDGAKSVDLPVQALETLHCRSICAGHAARGVASICSRRQSQHLASSGIELPGLTARPQLLIQVSLGLIEPIGECRRLFVASVPEIVEQSPYQLAAPLDFLLVR